MKKSLIVFIVLSGISISAFPQEGAYTKNIILVTLDGVRWKEVFTGADKQLINSHKYVHDTEALKKKFWINNPDTRRKLLMPFLWSTISNEGQIYGNRLYGNKVNLTNDFWFSYPGYNEILTGIKNDSKINSNHKVENPNETVFEYLNLMPAYQNKVAVISSWYLFSYILNADRSKIFVSSGNDFIKGDHLTDKEKELNAIESRVPSTATSRPDSVTSLYAMDYLKLYSPRVLFISYAETDDMGHLGKYDQYLDDIHNIDHYIEQLWNYIQSNPEYRDKTTLIITTDHGRGQILKSSWKNHGRAVPGSNHTWFAVIGPDTSQKGEIKTAERIYQNQLARTMAAFLDVNFNLYKDEGKTISQVIQNKTLSEVNTKNSKLNPNKTN